MMRELTPENLRRLFEEQLADWPQAVHNYAALENVRSREIEVGGFPAILQFNPARIISSAAKVDPQSIKSRKCFLCTENRPSAQEGLSFTGPSGNEYAVLINPLPIFRHHLTIPDISHTQQQIEGRYEDMLRLTERLEDYVIFYNGPHCGASAPDHMHFQAGNKGFLPIEKKLASLDKLSFYHSKDTELSFLKEYVDGTAVIESFSFDESVEYFYRLAHILKVNEDEIEPRLNILAWREGDKYITVVFLRKAHRPECFYLQGDDNILLSPASVDFGGVFVLPLEKDFNKVTSGDLERIIEEVSYNSIDMNDLEDRLQKEFVRYQPKVNVGIMFEPEIIVEFLSKYTFSDVEVFGLEKFRYKDDKIEWRGKCYDELFFQPEDYTDSVFELKDVTIGINFHWERKENQRFQGGLVIIVENGKLTAINLVGVEDYLISVISSEMSATASKEFLKAHSVISRSWLLAQMDKSEKLNETSERYSACTEDEHQRIKWYDREDHTSFDVCADDHCQRYQGITRASTPIVKEVISETWGELLMYNGAICDARFSKCCGGVFEEFPTCWENASHPYLQKALDVDDKNAAIPDLTVEENAEKWILSSPESFCNTSDKRMLSQVLNNYDQETIDFYRWRVEYTADEISAIARERSGIDFGEITDMIPLKRGTSGRIYELKIIGTKKTMIIGKELEIRKTLSRSHLYSSAFIVRKEAGKFILLGAGWGHGVGLCQIGAAAMGDKGYKYDQILLHYFIGAQINKKY